MILDKKYIAAFAASFGLMAIGSAANATVLDGSTGTTYTYLSGTPLPPFTTGTGQEYPGAGNSQAQGTNENTTLVSNYGVGILNDGLLGNQAYLDSGILRPDGYPSAAANFASFSEGANLQTGADAIQANTSSQAYSESVYYSAAFTIKFNLGASYTNLSTANFYWDIDPDGMGIPASVSITDGTNTAVETFSDGAADQTAAGGYGGGGPHGHGEYFEDSVDISGLSGQFLTLTFSAPGESFEAFQEINFTTSPVPEPASLGLLSLGGLALLGRRGRRA